MTPLMAKLIADFPSKHGMMPYVAALPGEENPVHRHAANALVYGLEGSIVMQVKGREATTLLGGPYFYELPAVVHTIGKNAGADSSRVTVLN